MECKAEELALPSSISCMFSSTPRVLSSSLPYSLSSSANDKEDDRMAYDSILSPRALREIYLMPFMLAQKYAQPWAYMSA